MLRITFVWMYVSIIKIHLCKKTILAKHTHTIGTLLTLLNIYSENAFFSVKTQTNYNIFFLSSGLVLLHYTFYNGARRE